MKHPLRAAVPLLFVRTNNIPEVARMHIAGSTVLLTGATGGIGHALARALADRGAALILSGRRKEVLDALATALPKDRPVRTIAADLSDPADVQRLATEAADAAEGGSVDILVANAALPGSGELLEYEPDQIERALTVNLHAPILLSRLLTPAMVRAGRGHVALIGSLSGKAASPSASIYNATKFGLRGFGNAFRQDLHGTGVGVSVVQPGFVRDAGMFADSGAKPPAGARTVSPEQVANATLSAIERNRGEVNVAPIELRLGSSFAGLFPELAGRIQRRAATNTMRQLAEGQRTKR
jgi:short-subunit dehydrogenase